MALEQEKHNKEVRRRMELDQLTKEMAAHFRISDEVEQQAHYRSWRHALKSHMLRHREYYYE